MFGKLFQKTSPRPLPQQSEVQESPISSDVAPRVVVHYGIPSTASVLAFDSVQQLLAVGTLDGRIKVVGGDSIEGLLMSPKPIPFKNLEFLQNQGYLVSISNENEIQVWDLESRSISTSLQWESNITAFSVIYGTQFMYIGDEYGFLSVLKYDAEEQTILQLPYHIPANLVAEAAEISLPFNQSIVGVLPQPSSFGNRLLLAYEDGLIVLWDVTEDRAVLVRGNKDLQLKDEMLAESSGDGSHEPLDNLLDHEKEISSLCWVSGDGSLLAVGYVDGDIFLWNLSASDHIKGQGAQKSSDKVVKIQLSSAERRLPVIVLHWSANKKRNGFGGQLFVYGGEEIGSEEVLTILDLDWSSGIAKLTCVHRVDLPLNGSFSDMIVIARSHEMEKTDSASLLVLTNPGQLHFYDDSCLSTLRFEPDKKHSVLAVEYPATIPTIEPIMTVGKLYSVVAKANSSRVPLTGGVPGELSIAEDGGMERIYVAGYQDGSVRVWDSTFPVLSLRLVFLLQVEGIDVAGASASISTLDFSPTSLSLAIGNEYGLVWLYGLDGTKDKSGIHLVTQTERQVLNLPHDGGSLCKAIFSLLNSPVRTFKWVNSGDRLAVGFECGQVAMVETSALSVLFLTDALCGSSPIISLAVKTLPDTESLKQSEIGTSNESVKEVACILTRDSHVVLEDNSTLVYGILPAIVFQDRDIIQVHAPVKAISVLANFLELKEGTNRYFGLQFLAGLACNGHIGILLSVSNPGVTAGLLTLLGCADANLQDLLKAVEKSLGLHYPDQAGLKRLFMVGGSTSRISALVAQLRLIPGPDFGNDGQFRTLKVGNILEPQGLADHQTYQTQKNQQALPFSYTTCLLQIAKYQSEDFVWKLGTLFDILEDKDCLRGRVCHGVS